MLCENVCSFEGENIRGGVEAKSMMRGVTMQFFRFQAVQRAVKHGVLFLGMSLGQAASFLGIRPSPRVLSSLRLAD